MSKEIKCPSCSKVINYVTYEEMNSEFTCVSLDGIKLDIQNDGDTYTVIRCPECMLILYDGDLDPSELYDQLKKEERSDI